LKAALPSLDFEFVERRGAGWIGWALLVIGALFVADLARTYFTLRNEVPRIEARLTAENRTLPSEKPARNAATAEELTEARAVVARFAAPWPALFAAIEASRIDEVSLLTIEPEASSGHVVITGEARNYLAVLTYVARLEAQAGLGRVHLARHEVRETEPRRPVAFSISARWRQR
jgi:hypothetical protein